MDYIHRFHTKDGDLIRLRSLRPEDAHHLVNLFDHMGPESRYLRFNLALPDPDRELVWAEARQLARIDPERDGAWLAFAQLSDNDEIPVGGVRYMRIDDQTAEASITVRDDMQNKGIGNELLQFLIRQARQAGVRKLVATVQRNNRPIFHLLSKTDLRLEYESEGGYTTITAFLNEAENSPIIDQNV
ncbi:MAG: GNAT family protein [Chloroflexota bacterium]|jgi:acetyltransferase